MHITAKQVHSAKCTQIACVFIDISMRMNYHGRHMKNTETTLKQLQAAYRTALMRECQELDRMSDKPSKAQLVAAWNRAERTNQALKTLQAARDAAEYSA